MDNGAGDVVWQARSRSRRRRDVCRRDGRLSPLACRLPSAPVSTLALDPALLDRFAVKVGRQTGKVSLSLDGPSGAILVRYPDEPNAVGLLMPCRDTAPVIAPADVWRDLIAPPTPTQEPTPEPFAEGEASV